MLRHQLLDRKQGGINHHRRLRALRRALAALTRDGRRRIVVGVEILRRRIRHLQGTVVLCFHKGSGLCGPLIELCLGDACGQALFD